MDIPEHIAAISDAGAAFADAADHADFGATVPSCPEWTVRDLVFHLGGVHRWATRLVAEALSERPEAVAMDPVADAAQRPSDAELSDWFRQGHAGLVAALTAAPDDMECWTFMRTAPTSRAFWARRQAHETTVHRVDIQQATGTVAPVDPALAADGVDELLTGFLSGRRARLRADTPTTVAIHTTDTDASWQLTVSTERLVVERAATGADVTVVGTAHEVYLALWNRAPMDSLRIEGDRTLVDRWSELAQVI